jgi:hypothetical protein
MKQFMALLRLSPVLLFALACLAAGSARAGTCSNPTGNESDMTYNKDYHTYQFCDGTHWQAFGGGVATGGLTLISTQTASNSASLQFSGANFSNSYNSLFLNCEGILTATSGGAMLVLVGEGATPTWETGAHYTNSNTIANGSDIIGGPPNFATATVPVSFKAYIDNPGSSTLDKIVSYSLNGYAGGGSPNMQTLYNVGWWNNDTNPLTGIELVGSSGNIKSATCSLYGMN